MSLSHDEVRRIAGLARLAVPDAALDACAHDLDAILDLVHRLDAAATAAVEPLAHPLDGVAMRLRADAVTEPDRRERLLALAPVAADGLYRVPRVIE